MRFMHGLARRKLLLLLTAMTLVATTAVPAVASPSEEFEEPIFGLWPDLTNEVSVWVNMTARDFCEWVANGEEGPPPVEKLISGTLKGRMGEVVGLFEASDVHVELWQFDEHVDVNDPETLIGPCEDIQDQLDDPDAQPWAAGTLSSYTGTDNDLFGDGIGGNSFGDTGSGMVTDGDGANWAFSWKFRVALDENDDLIGIRDTLSLKRLR